MLFILFVALHYPLKTSRTPLRFISYSSLNNEYIATNQILLSGDSSVLFSRDTGPKRAHAQFYDPTVEILWISRRPRALQLNRRILRSNASASRFSPASSLFMIRHKFVIIDYFMSRYGCNLSGRLARLVENTRYLSTGHHTPWNNVLQPNQRASVVEFC